MQAKSNIEQRNTSLGRKNGIVGTILIHAILCSLLILVGFSVPVPPQSEEGILVNFGTDETGMGLIEPSPPEGQKETSAPVLEEVAPPPSAPKSEPKTKDQSMLTQNTEDAPVVKTDPEAEKKKLEKLEADKIIREQKEAERIRITKEEAEKKRIAAEQQREADIMNRTKNALANSKNTGTNSTGEGIAGGPGNQGDPRGSINSDVRGTGGGTGDSGTGTGGSGISYNLEGRGVEALPPPRYDSQTEGKVVVEVHVDPSGKVVYANPGTKGSSTLEPDLLKTAREAALKARFKVKSDAPAIQKGTITYNFILK